MTVSYAAFRLAPGADLRASLVEYCVAERIEAACVLSGVGSLSVAAMRYAGREDATLLRGDFEIVSLTGTLSRHGCHLHVSVADADGLVSGGHLLGGSIVRTTAEIVLAVLPGVRFVREHDVATGFRELKVETLSRG